MALFDWQWGKRVVVSSQLQDATQPINDMTTKPRYELLDDMECVVATADSLQDLAYAQALDGLRRPLYFDTKLGRCVEAPEKESN